MKKITLLLLSFLSLGIGYSQTTPTNVLLSEKQISGNADKTSVIKVDIEDGEKATYTIVVNYIGYFEYQFPTPLKITDKPISIWAENEDGKKSKKLKLIPKTDSQLLTDITAGKAMLPFKKLPPVIEQVIDTTFKNPKLSDVQLKNTTYKFKTKIINTNFTIPVARFNTVRDSESNSKVGDIILFNSIGAGVGVSWGELERSTNENYETINSDFTSTFGIHLGVLFSAGSGEESKNVFAPTLSLSVLDFQVGYGYELGTIETGQKRHFWTIAYAIPLSKLVKGKYYVLTSSKGYNSKNPFPKTKKGEEEKETIWGYF